MEERASYILGTCTSKRATPQQHFFSKELDNNCFGFSTLSLETWSSHCGWASKKTVLWTHLHSKCFHMSRNLILVLIFVLPFKGVKTILRSWAKQKQAPGPVCTSSWLFLLMYIKWSPSQQVIIPLWLWNTLCNFFFFFFKQHNDIPGYLDSSPVMKLACIPGEQRQRGHFKIRACGRGAHAVIAAPTKIITNLLWKQPSVIVVPSRGIKWWRR